MITDLRRWHMVLPLLRPVEIQLMAKVSRQYLGIRELTCRLFLYRVQEMGLAKEHSQQILMHREHRTSMPLVHGKLTTRIGEACSREDVAILEAEDVAGVRSPTRGTGTWRDRTLTSRLGFSSLVRRRRRPILIPVPIRIRCLMVSRFLMLSRLGRAVALPPRPPRVINEDHLLEL